MLEEPVFNNFVKCEVSQANTKTVKRKIYHANLKRQLKLNFTTRACEEKIEMEAKAEIRRIIAYLKRTKSYNKSILLKYKLIRSKLKEVIDKYRGPEYLVPVIIYYMLKLNNHAISKTELLEVSKIKERLFNPLMVKVRKFFPKYIIRDRKKYVELSLDRISERLRLGGAFYYKAKQIMYRLWENFCHAKDDTIAGVIASITALCYFKDKVRVSQICKELKISQSSIQRHLTRNIFKKYKISGFKSPVKSSDLLRRVVSKMIDFYKEYSLDNGLAITTTTDPLVYCSV